MNTTKEKIDALSAKDKARLYEHAAAAIRLDEQQLTLQVAGRASMPVDHAQLHQARMARADGEHIRTEQALSGLATSRPDLAVLVEDMRSLASERGDPANARLLASMMGSATAEQRRAAQLEAEQRDHNRALHQQPPPLPELANEILADSISAALSAKPDPSAVPGVVTQKYLHEGREFRPIAAPQSVAFVDRGAKLQTNADFDGTTIKAMVDIAEARGWSSLKLTGSEAFRRAAWYEATTRGLAVTGYKPTEAEQTAATAAGERSGRLNRIEANPAVEAFLSAQTGEDRLRAASRHPELKNAFAHLEAHRRFADARMTQGSREAYVDLQRKHLARDIAAGVSLPSVDVRSRAPRPRVVESVRDR